MDKQGPTHAVPASEKQGGGSFGQFSMKNAQTGEQPKPSAFGGFKMNSGGEQAVPATGGSKFGNYKVGMGAPEPGNRNRSMSCYQVALNKAQPAAAPGYEQKIPSLEYLNKKRGSVFQKVDLKALDDIKIPQYTKTDSQMQVIMPLLAENFMTMSLSHDLRVKIAGAMKIENYKPGDKIITYGDSGRDYFILS